MKRIRLGNYCKITAGGDKPKVFSIIKNDECFVPVYSNGIENNGLVGYTNKATISEESVTVAARGSCGYAFFRDTPYVPIIRLISIIPFDDNVLDTKYLYYLLKLLPYQGIGSVQSQITVPQISDYSIDFIDDNIKQKKIAKTLSLLDYKIENNNKINAELESMAKTLYDYWFLQFEFPNENGKPYKSSGGKMVWNEELKREIPEGWEAIKLRNIVKKTNRVYDYNKESKTYDLSIMPSNSISINDTSSSKDFETNLFAVKEGDILFGSIRPYLRKAGIASYDGAVAGTIHCYQVIKESNYNLALFTLTSENMFKYAINNSKGTKMPVITSDDLLEFMLPYNEEIAKKFNNIKIREIIIANIKQSNELASLRDFLLPLLMNGQVTFKK